MYENTNVVDFVVIVFNFVEPESSVVFAKPGCFITVLNKLNEPRFVIRQFSKICQKQNYVLMN